VFEKEKANPLVVIHLKSKITQKHHKSVIGRHLEKRTT